MSAARIPTLGELRKIESEVDSLQHRAKRHQERADALRKCGGRSSILEWWASRRSYGNQDYDGLTKLLEDAAVEFGPLILEALAARELHAAHEASTKATLKRAELGAYVTLDAEGGAA